MAIQPPDTGDIRRERPVARPLPGDFVTTPSALHELKIPDEVLLTPENIASFLAGQGARYNEIVDRPEIKTFSAQIPEYNSEDPLLPTGTVLNREEQLAMQSWVEERLGDGNGNLLASQSSDPQIAQTIRDTDQLIDDAIKSGQLKDFAGPDPLDSALLNKYAETKDNEEKWHQMLAVAASGGVENVILVLALRESTRASNRIQRVLVGYQEQVSLLEKIRADFDLKNKGGQISMTDLAKFNADVSAVQGGVGHASFLINQALQQYERGISAFASIEHNYDESQKTALRNLLT